MPELIHITAPTFQNAVHFIKKKKKKGVYSCTFQETLWILPFSLGCTEMVKSSRLMYLSLEV